MLYTANDLSDIIESHEFEALVPVTEIQRSLCRNGENFTDYLILFHPVKIYIDVTVA